MKLLLTSLFLSFCLSGTCQKLDSLTRMSYLNSNQQAFVFAGAWSAGNLALSSLQLYQTTGIPQHRAQMNLAWSAINTAIFSFAYAQNQKLIHAPNLDWKERRQKFKRAFMINTFLDVAYIGGGYLLTRHTGQNPEQNKGFGQAIVFQGSFLLGFDAFMWFKHRKKNNKS